MLSAHNALPQEGHLEVIYHIFLYLKGHKNSRLVFDPAYLDINDRRLTSVDWTDFYLDTTDELLLGVPERRGMPIEISCFVDADHTGNLATRWSQTGILIFINKAPIIWFSKCQNTVESSTFGSEFFALQIATDILISLRYRLHVFGIPIIGPANVFCDNQGDLGHSIYDDVLQTN